mmetsp:Transcript_5496/g.18584  ORF Transcript_5496/g.18584 Transcript_5496/m.18584 type:complete len:238 (+) Transcript_5496:132-845(+)
MISFVPITVLSIAISRASVDGFPVRLLLVAPNELDRARVAFHFNRVAALYGFDDFRRYFFVFESQKTRLFALFEIDKLDFTVRFKRTFNALAKLDEIVPLHVCFFAQSDSRNHPGRVHNLFLFARFAVVFFVLSSSSSSVVIVVSATFATVVVIIVIVTTIAHHDFPFRSFPLLVQLCVLLRIGRSVRLLLRFLFRLQRLLLLLLLQILLLKHQRQLRAFVHQRVGHSRHLFRALLR